MPRLRLTTSSRCLVVKYRAGVRELDAVQHVLRTHLPDLPVTERVLIEPL